MKRLLSFAAIVVAISATTISAEAKGCFTGGAAGHHAIVGAVTGCYAGHHMAHPVKQHRQPGDEKVQPTASTASAVTQKWPSGGRRA
jgi:hypothetical protein